MHVEMTQKNIAMPKIEPIHIKVDHSLKKKSLHTRLSSADNLCKQFRHSSWWYSPKNFSKQLVLGHKKHA